MLMNNILYKSQPEFEFLKLIEGFENIVILVEIEDLNKKKLALEWHIKLSSECLPLLLMTQTSLQPCNIVL